MSGFAFIPAALMELKPSPDALSVYIALALKCVSHNGMGPFDESIMSPEEIAEDSNLSLKTVHESLDELLALGAVTVSSGTAWSSNV